LSLPRRRLAVEAAVVSVASSLIRRVRPGTWESSASTWYSKWLIPASRRNCASRVPPVRLTAFADLEGNRFDLVTWQPE
jgi:hypothetical protein